MQKLMKPMLFVLMTVLGAALAVVPGRAQSGNRVEVNIPFDFSVGNTPLRAGSYRIVQLEADVLVLSSNDGPQHQFALTVHADSSNRNQQPHLVFKRYGSETFLTKVFLSGSDDCYDLLRSNREKKLVKEQSTGEELSVLIQPAH